MLRRDISKILQNSYDRITNKELQKVSQLMNTLFLEMIGADAEQGAIIQKAEISKDFDILVYGPNERALNPDRDLNGASRRSTDFGVYSRAHQRKRSGGSKCD